jgi:hypothetical protein
LEDKADGFSRHIRARLTIPAALFIGYPKSLLELLPGPNITVRLGRFECPRSVLELMPESVARENLLLPLDQQQGPVLLVGACNADDPELVQKLEFILNRDIVLVRAEPDDVVAAINRHYGQTEVESIDCVLYESPLVGLQGDDESGALFSLFHTAFSRSTTGFEMALTGCHSQTRYLRGDQTAFEETTTATAYHRLLDHLLSLGVDRSYTEGNLRCIEVQIPLLSGRPFPVTVERERGWWPRKWFRVRFRW